MRQLTSEAGISGVTLSAVKLMEEPSGAIEVEGREGQAAEAQFNSVDDRFLEVFGVRVLAGRTFDASDFRPGRTPVIVNRSFVTEVLGDPPSSAGTGANALGRRIRYREQNPRAARPAEPARRA